MNSVLKSTFIFLAIFVTASNSQHPDRLCGNNEYIDECHNKCEQTCSNQEAGVRPPAPCKTPCTRGCNCAPNYVRSPFGTCIGEWLCKPITCDSNEEVAVCANTCEQTCVRLQSGMPAPNPCESPCIAGCVCKPGFVRGPAGSCIAVSFCPPIRCGLNEVVSECDNTCEQTCNNRKAGVDPPSPCEKPCIPGCNCAPGYVRNHEGKCIPEWLCQPIACGPNQILEICDNSCEQTCEKNQLGIREPRPCTHPCEAGCDCAPGYLRISEGRDRGQCVRESVCPRIRCREHEVPTLCEDDCEQTCDDRILGIPEREHCRDDGHGPGGHGPGGHGRGGHGPGGHGPGGDGPGGDGPGEDGPGENGPHRHCRPGCKCAEGYLRGRRGRCVEIDHCRPLSCGVNQVKRLCANSCEQTCNNEQAGVARPVPCVEHCRPGCNCLPGHVRNLNGQCVSELTCPIIRCDRNQVLALCANTCEQTCTNSILGIAAPSPCTQPCVAGCNCAPGYVRSASGTCIAATMCPTLMCGPNQEPSINENTCERSCDDVILGIPAPTPCLANPGCNCVSGYVRTVMRECVIASSCPALICGVNEIKTLCSNTCEQTCINNILGVAAPTPCLLNCIPGCNCAPGYFRNAAGLCVPESQCRPLICDDNELPVACKNGCEHTCNNNRASIPAPTPCRTPCVPGCECQTSYLRSLEGTCVDVNTLVCAPIMSCPNSNEIVVACKEPCEQTCNNLILGISAPDSCNEPCVAGCDCAPGYVRTTSLTCVAASTCVAITCGSNEVPTLCRNTCEQTCDNLLLGDPTPQPCVSSCSQGCDCEIGYVRSSMGYCVSESSCDQYTCKANEEAVNNHNTAEQTCNNLKAGVSAPTPVTTNTGPGCNCKMGFVRDTNKQCVAIASCAPITCGANEVVAVCQDLCERTCLENILGTGSLVPCTNPCIAGCNCATNYVRDSTGACVSGSASMPPGRSIDGKNLARSGASCAPLNCGANQEGSTCANTNEQTCVNNIMGIPAPPHSFPCANGCQCKDGYVRDAMGACVDIAGCGTVTCGEHEVIVLCNNNCEQNCNRHQASLPPPMPCTTGCTPGCDCVPGYVRRDGECVGVWECPPLDCNENEVAMECTNLCEVSCSESLTGTGATSACRTPCEADCDCVSGYVRSDETGRCIPAASCATITCAANQDKESETNLCEQTCLNEKLGLDTPYPPCVESKEAGCDCKSGFYYAVSSGVPGCVPVASCAALTCGANAKAVRCANTCEHTCHNNILGMSPPTPCYNNPCTLGCSCEPGYVRSGTGGASATCVDIETCPPLKCRSYETRVDCKNTCEETCNNLRGGGTSPMPCTMPCFPGCDCASGLVRTQDGTCIPGAFCPPITCGTNEVRAVCRNNCPQTCNNNILGKPSPNPCTTPCQVGCDCASGFLRNSLGVCVAASTCVPLSCGNPATSHRIPIICSDDCEQTCHNIINGIVVKPCFVNCSPGCDCLPGFVRSELGQCIPYETCKLTTCGINEVVVDCDNTCEQTCARVQNANNSPAPCNPSPCVPGCDCAPNHVRNAANICVPVSSCPTLTCPANEIRVLCTNNCEQTCDRQILGIPPPSSPCDSPCVAGCNCMPSFLRSETGTCVSSTMCPTLVCGANQIPTLCANTCEQTCDRNRLSLLPPNPCLENCVPGCNCRPGYVRDSAGACVAVSTCPELNCGHHRVPKLCANNCQQTCTNHILGISAPTPCTSPCTPGCDCDEDFLKLDDRCVHEHECPRLRCEPNQVVVACANTCEQTCNNLKAGVAAPLPCTVNCRPGCNCAPGFVRSSSRRCVAVSSCQLLTCEENEIPVACANSCEQTCNNNIAGIPIPTPCTRHCEAGCNCKPGFVRNSSGKCVSVNTCPALSCGANQVPALCANTCEQTCNNNILGIGAPPPCLRPCVPGCNCAPGYVRSSNGACVAVTTCTNIDGCVGENQVLVDCNNRCEQTCKNTKAGLAAPTPCTIPCIAGCDCAPGFVRDFNNRCISDQTCTQCNYPNEVYTNCLPRCYNTCFTNRPHCPLSFNTNCQSGCACNTGYVKNIRKQCVLPSQCGYLGPKIRDSINLDDSNPVPGNVTIVQTNSTETNN